MKLRPALLVVHILFTGGCAVLEQRHIGQHPLVSAPASADEALEIARVELARGQSARAIQVLESARRRFPDDARLVKEAGTLAELLQRRVDELEDRILVGDAENQKHKIALLETLSGIAPDNLLVTARRIYWREVLDAKLERLTACGERYVTAEPELARRCFDVALDLAAPEAIERRLVQVGQQLRANEALVAERQKATEQRERQQRAKVLLGNARTAIDAHDYRGALDILDRVAQLQPQNTEVAGLQQEAWSMIGPQFEALVKLGDHLYLDEQLDAALATWQAALALRPDDTEIRARIERARTVLDRLDALRRQQQSSGSGD